jgi:hypothetical protein
MPGDSGVTVVTCLRAFYFCTQGCGRIERPAFPAPSDLQKAECSRQNSGMRREIADAYLQLFGRQAGMLIATNHLQGDALPTSEMCR